MARWLLLSSPPLRFAASASRALRAPVAGGPSGQRARTICPSASWAVPSRRFSHAAHATMTPLSVHSRGGGTRSSHGVPPGAGAGVASHSSCRRRRSSALDATPPETTSVLGGVSPASAASSAHSLIAYLMRCSRCEIAACWKELATPARKARVSRTSSGARCTARRTAVLSPAKEKSYDFLRCIGTGSGTASGAPSRASASSAGPPPPPMGSPSSLATLSYASPKASSSVEPMTRWSPTPLL